MTIEVALSSNAGKVLAQLDRMPAQMLDACRRTLDSENKYTVTHIQRSRLTGKGPYPVSEHRLGHVTGNLMRSLKAEPAFILGDSVISSIGSNVRYAIAHEFGVDKIVTVRGFTRRRPRRSARFDLRTGQRIKATRRTAGSVMVWGHQRHMRLPARAPVTHGILDRLPDYSRALSRAILEAWR